MIESSELIFWPVIVVAMVTLWLYVPMSQARVRTVREGRVKGSVYKLNREEPEESLRFSNAIRNQYETPVLFYVVCLAAYVTGTAGLLMIVLAFLFAAIKATHVVVHVTTNNLRHRRPVFMAAYLVLAAMWVVFAVQLFMNRM